MSSDKDTINELSGMLEGAREEIFDLEIRLAFVEAALKKISTDGVVYKNGECIQDKPTWAAKLAQKTLAKLKGES